MFQAIHVSSNLAQIFSSSNFPQASLVAQLIKNLPAMQETQLSAGDLGLIPRLGRGERNALQHSCQGSPMDGQRSLMGYSPWGCKSQTRLSN